MRKVEKINIDTDPDEAEQEPSPSGSSLSAFSFTPIPRQEAIDREEIFGGDDDDDDDEEEKSLEPSPSQSSTMSGDTSDPKMPDPPIPNHGDLIQSSKDFKDPWVGGIPGDDDFTVCKSKEYTSALQLRPVGSYGLKGLVKRQQGLEPKLDGSDLKALEQAIFGHAENHGLLTICYLPDPVADPMMPTRTCVIDDHAKFTTGDDDSLLIAAYEAQVAKYDAYNKAQDKDLMTMFLQSLTSEVLNPLRIRYPEYTKARTGFPVLWIAHIRNLQLTAVSHYEKLIAKLKAIKPEDYSGQDIKQMCQDYRALIEPLVLSGRYKHSLTKVMLNSLMTGGGDMSPDLIPVSCTTRIYLWYALWTTCCSVHVTRQLLIS